MSTWFASAFKKFAEITPALWGILAALVILGIVLYALTRQKQRWTARMIANAALSIALAFVLSYIRLYKLPQGGAITPASMLPILLFAYAYGVVPGMTVGAAYGVLQFIQDAYFVHPVELLLDYPLAFAMLGLAGIAHNSRSSWSLVKGILLGVCGRFLRVLFACLFRCPGIVGFLVHEGDLHLRHQAAFVRGHREQPGAVGGPA